MNHNQIIQLLIDKKKYTSYLEIGASDRATFNTISVDHKVAVDPAFAGDHQVTSDEFFNNNKETFDIIFIDGLHHAEQVCRDIDNALQSLNPNGLIVCHDMLPISVQEQMVPRIQDVWTGDCWKAFLWFRSIPNLSMYTIDIDHGCGIISKGSQEILVVDQPLYDDFEKNKKVWMNIITLDEFRNSVDMIDDDNDSEVNEVFAEKWSDKLKSLKKKVGPNMSVATDGKYSGRTIMIAPYSNKLSNGLENPKNFPYWQELMELIRSSGIYTIQVGVAGENIIGDETMFNSNNVALLSRLKTIDTFISVDTFFPHFAAFYKKKGLVIFSQSDPLIFGHSLHVNILKSRQYLRENQFNLWTQATYDKEAFPLASQAFEELSKILDGLNDI